MWKFRRSHHRRRANNFSRSDFIKSDEPLRIDDNLLRLGKTLPQTRKHKLQVTLGRLERLGIQVPRTREKYRNLNEKIIHTHKLLKDMSYKINDRVFLKRDSEICRRRKKIRDDILRSTAGKGLRIKNADWTFDSYVQCK